MSEAEDQTAAIGASWDANADAWSAVVRGGRIPSRRAATDAAIISAAVRHRSGPLLDVGCGEGWLAHALAERGIEVIGVDGSARLIELARESGQGIEFHVATYDEIIAVPTLLAGPFTAIVLNFALLAEDIVPLLRSLASRLSANGALLIQTLHPWTARGTAPYADGWRVERFDAFEGAFPAPMPWYFRTMQSWADCIQEAGLSIARLEEPAHPETREPLSLLLTCRGRELDRDNRTS